MLEPLDECEEGLEEDSLDGDDDPQHLEGADGTLLQPTATVILTNMENLTMELGSAQSFWDLDYSTWGCLATPSWITYTWRDLRETSLSLKGPHTLSLPQSNSDLFLMDVFVSRGFTSEHLHVQASYPTLRYHIRGRHLHPP